MTDTYIPRENRKIVDQNKDAFSDFGKKTRKWTYLLFKPNIFFAASTLAPQYEANLPNDHFLL